MTQKGVEAMSTSDETSLVQTIAALQSRMLSDYKRTAWQATALTIVALGMYAATAHWHADFWVFVAVMAVFLAAVWGHYILTSFRVRKGYFGNNAAEALEEIEFIQNEDRRRGETIKK